jgi:hypothetical protein
MNYLKAVFWDYPQFTDPSDLRRFLQEKSGSDAYLWGMQRFLEHGRVVDALGFFKIEEISGALPRLKLTPYCRKKWERITEVYGNAPGK